MRQARFAIASLVLIGLSGCATTQGTSSTSSGSGSTTDSTPAPPPPAPPEASGMITTRTGLQYQDLRVGDGALAESGMEALVHYTGTFTDGRKFDSSYDRQKPYPFRLDSGAVIRGWDEGIQGMRVGGKRKLIVPPHLAYGAAGYGNGAIPPNTTLVFEVELLDTR